MSRFAWTSFTVERLLSLRAQGLLLSRIAAELGTTPYAIEHKLRRLRDQRPRQAPAALPLKLLDLRAHHCRGLCWGAGRGRCSAASHGWGARPTVSSTR